jgi:L-malate glycosyltransferase
MNILFYTPFSDRSRDTESLMEAFIKQGHSVFLLTQTERGIYHDHCEKLAVNVNSYSLKKRNTLIYFISHCIYLIRFVKKNKINIVYAHTENAALPAVLAQYFIKAKVFACRHIIDEAYLLNSKKFILLNKIVYALAKDIIVVSERCKRHMVEKEKIIESKIKTIFLAYNFSLYQKPNLLEVKKIKEMYPADLLLLTACRMLKAKKVETSIAVLEKLLVQGINVKLIILGNGQDIDFFKKIVSDKKLTASVFFLGFILNVQDYLAACDMLIHPSIQDSSSVIIKEAGLCKVPIIVCEGIGDVDDYLVNNKNAFIVSQTNTENDMFSTVISNYKDKNKLKLIGENLNTDVKNRFSIEKIISQYDNSHSNF